MEFLLGQYCSSDDPEVIEEGVESVKRILADNFVRPDEAQKILSMLRQRGSHTVIDKVTVTLNIKDDRYEAEFSNLGLKNIPIQEEYPCEFVKRTENPDGGGFSGRASAKRRKWPGNGGISNKYSGLPARKEKILQVRANRTCKIFLAVFGSLAAG